MRIRTSRLAVLALLASSIGLSACGNDDNDNSTTAPSFTRVYNQVERLGNPLVSEVMLAKRTHGFHNKGMPSTDAANFSAEVKAFVKNVAGRPDVVGNTLATVLLPDMLIVQTNKPASGAGWLTWALADGYGGRKLTDDVVDAGLAAIFGSLLNPMNVSPGLATDNVGANDKAFGASFPYLAAPTN
ncbi:MAG: DUF4331 family protein [Gemmatimonadaceae bacterium]